MLEKRTYTYFGGLRVKKTKQKKPSEVGSVDLRSRNKKKTK